VLSLTSKMWHFPTISVDKEPTDELRSFLIKLVPALARDRRMRLEPLSRARHAVTYRAITLLPFSILVPKLPELPDATSISLSELVSPSAIAVSNLTRKIARAALAEPIAIAIAR